MRYLIKNVFESIKDKIEKKYDFLESKKIVISGMGASGIIGNLIEDYFNFLGKKDERFKKLIIVNKTYELPKYVDEGWLSICISYSGKTEETLSVLKQSLEKNIPTVFISSNPEIENLYHHSHYFPLVVPKTDLPPRYNLASLLSGALSLFFEKERIMDIFNFNSKLYEKDNEIVQELLSGKIPVVYSDYKTRSLSERIAQQFNENSKIHCVYGYFSETNHNQLEVQPDERFIYFLLRHNFEHERINKRFEIIKELFDKKGIKYFEIKSNEDDLMKAMLEILNNFDYISIKLGMERGVPFDQNPQISYLKERLKQSL